ncbi:MAG: BMP family ABC transporter substrate-binding protein [Candidatus Thorarchaeota archaeon]
MSSRSGNVASIIIVILVFSAVGGYVFITNQYVPSNIAVVVLDPGRGDSSIVDQAYQGLFMIDVVVNYDYRRANNTDHAQDILEDIASRGRHDLIIVIGSDPDLHTAVQTVAEAHQNQKFALIGGSVPLDNVASATFAHKEAAFLAGSLAAHVSVGNPDLNGIVGIIAAVATDPTLTEIIDGFLQGLRYANETIANATHQITLLPTEYVGSFNDTTTAETIATDMYNPYVGNASVIFAPVRASLLGIRAAMEWANLSYHAMFGNETTREPFVVGAEFDQGYLGNPNIEIASGPSWVIGSIIPRSDLAIYRIINASLWDEFPGGLENGSVNQTIGDLENEGIDLGGLEEFRNDVWVTDPMLNVTATIREMIINGTIVIT